MLSTVGVGVGVVGFPRRRRPPRLSPPYFVWTPLLLLHGGHLHRYARSTSLFFCFLKPPVRGVSHMAIGASLPWRAMSSASSISCPRSRSRDARLLPLRFVGVIHSSLFVRPDHARPAPLLSVAKSAAFVQKVWIKNSHRIFPPLLGRRSRRQLEVRRYTLSCSAAAKYPRAGKRQF